MVRHAQSELGKMIASPGTPGSGIFPEDSVSQVSSNGRPELRRSRLDLTSIAAASTTSTSIATALLAPDLARTSKASSSSGLEGGQTHFTCLDCRLILPMTMMSISKKGHCNKDVASFKSLSDRWQKQRCLRNWWTGMDKDGQCEWYHKQQEVAKGTKRKFDDVIFQESSKKVAQDVEKELDTCIPWWMFKNEQLSIGNSVDDAATNWQQAIDEAGSEAIWRRGQWLLPRFSGVTLAKEKIQTNEREVIKQNFVGDSDELKDLVSKSDKSLDAFFNSGQRPALCSQDTKDMPQVERVLKDETVYRPPVDIVIQSCEKEVPIGNLEQW